MNNSIWVGIVVSFLLAGVAIGQGIRACDTHFTGRKEIQSLQSEKTQLSNAISEQSDTIKALQDAIKNKDLQISSLQPTTRKESYVDDKVDKLILENNRQLEIIKKLTTEKDSLNNKITQLLSYSRGVVPATQSQSRSELTVSKYEYETFPFVDVTVSVGEIENSIYYEGFIVNGAITYNGGQESFKHAQEGFSVNVNDGIVQLISINDKSATFVFRKNQSKE